MHVNNVLKSRAATNAYATAAMSRSRGSNSVLAQKPQVFERVLKQSGGQEPVVDLSSCLTMPALGRIWKELAARLT